MYNFDRRFRVDADPIDLATQEVMAQTCYLRDALHSYQKDAMISINLAEPSVIYLFLWQIIKSVRIWMLDLQVWNAHVLQAAAGVLLNVLRSSAKSSATKWPMYDKLSTKIMKQVDSFNMPGGFYTRKEIVNHLKKGASPNDEPTLHYTFIKLLHIMVGLFS